MGRDMDCSHEPLASALTPADAIAYSCNSFVTSFARNMKNEALAAALASYGLGEVTGLAAGEAQSEITVPASVEQRQLMAIGESNILVTPLALAAAYRRLARRIHEPRMQPVLDGMQRSVTVGTSQLARSAKVSVAGKTGTALSVDASRRHAWFAGFAPADHPKVVVVVFVPQGAGAWDAAPIARKVVDAWALTQ